VCLSGTFNWLSVFDFNVLDVEQYVIISLNLGTNTWTQMRLPHGFDKNLVYVCPTISMLMGWGFLAMFSTVAYYFWNYVVEPLN